MIIVGEKIGALGTIQNWLLSPGVISGATDTSRWLADADHAPRHSNRLKVRCARADTGQRRCRPVQHWLSVEKQLPEGEHVMVPPLPTYK